MVCEEVVLVLVVVKTLGIGLTDAVVVDGMLEVPGLAVSDITGDLREFVVHVFISGWFRALLRPLLISTSARSPSELDRPRGLRHSDDGLDDSCILRRRRISARSCRM